MKSLEQVTDIATKLAESVQEKEQQVLALQRSVRFGGSLPEGMDEDAATRLMEEFSAEQSKLASLQKLLVFLKLASSIKGQLVAFDEFAELLPLIANDIAKEGIEPISELVSKVMPAITEILASSGKVIEPAIIELINLVINEVVNVGEGIQEAQKRFYGLRASNRMNALQAYMNSGFSREEAMALLLNDSKALNSASAQKIADAAGKAGSKAPSKGSQ